MKKIIVLMLVVLVAGLLVACGSPSDTNTTTQSNDDADDENALGDEDLADNQDSDLSPKEEFSALFDEHENTQYMVEYDMSSTAQGVSQQGTFAMYYKGDNTRMDFSGEQAGRVVESQTFVTSQGLTMCTKEADQWQCFIMPSDEDSESDDAVGSQMTQVSQNIDNYSGFEKINSRNIAGEKANCYSFVAGTQNQEMCISDQGIMLYFAVSAEGMTSSYEATSYSTTVSDSAFEPPVEPQDMADMFAGAFE